MLVAHSVMQQWVNKGAVLLQIYASVCMGSLVPNPPPIVRVSCLIMGVLQMGPCSLPQWCALLWFLWWVVAPSPGYANVWGALLPVGLEMGCP